jgi:hypothetical protein
MWIVGYPLGIRIKPKEKNHQRSQQEGKQVYHKAGKEEYAPGY